MRKTISTLVASLCFTISFAYSGKDSNIVIQTAAEYYSFDYSKKDNSVSVKQDMTTVYQCMDFRTSIAVAEYYDSRTSIDDVKISSDGKLPKITPTYDYYSVDNIFYSDARICYFEMPFEKKGTKNEVSFSKTINDPRYFTSVYFMEGYPVTSKTITLLIPRWMKVDIRELNFEGYNIKKTVNYNSRKDADEIVYTLENCPGRKREKDSPGPTYIEPHLLVLCKSAEVEGNKISYFGTLNDLYAWYHSITSNPENNTAVIKAKAEEITAGVTGDLEKVKKIFYWMHDNIRYIAFEDGLAGFKPQKADEVLRKKYGDCKGMAHLTKEFLKALGFDARLCWIGTNHIAYDYSTPSLAVDNHMIAALLYQGKTYFLDATENYISFNEYAERIQGRQVLIEDGDKYIFTKVPSTTYQQNLDLEKSVLSINGNALEGTVTREWKGEEKENILLNLNAIKKENSRDAFIRYLASGSNNIAIADFTTSSLTDYDKILSVSYKIKNSNAVSAFGNEMYIDLDPRKDMSDFTFDTNTRTLDYLFSYKLNTQMEIQLAIPADYNVTTIPQVLDVKNDDYEFSASVTKSNNKLIYSKKIIVKNIRLARTKFQQWNKDIEKLKAFYNEQVVLTKK